MMKIEDLFAHLGIPSELLLAYQHLGIKNLYQWQAQCLENTGVLHGENLIYCAPTSGGKSLVSELTILQTVLISRKKALVVLPYISLVVEKEQSFKKLISFLNRSRLRKNRLKTASYYGEKTSFKQIKENIIFCTIEKANVILNSFIGSGRTDRIGIVVLDEMHVLGNSFNGYLLEIFVR